MSEAILKLIEDVERLQDEVEELKELSKPVVPILYREGYKYPNKEEQEKICDIVRESKEGATQDNIRKIHEQVYKERLNDGG